MVNFTWSLGLNTQANCWERHAVLYFIEQGLMPRTGKRHEWKVGVPCRGIPLAATFQGFRWADEVLHARIGREWYVDRHAVPSTRRLSTATRVGRPVSEQIGVFWKEEGLTEHENWWPDLYRAACAQWGIEPDPRVLAFATSYEEIRPDMKAIYVSG